MSDVRGEGWVEPRIPIPGDRPDPATLVSVMTNAIGFEMFKHDHDVTLDDNGIEKIEISDEETARARAAAERVLREIQELL